MSKRFRALWADLKVPILAFVLTAVGVAAFTGFWPIISRHVFPNLTWGLYSRTFFENVLVEAHGMVLDLLVIGLVVYLFQLWREKADLRDSTLQTIENLRHYRGEDAGYRMYGELRRLASLGVTEVTIATARLANVSIKDLKLTNSNAQGLVLAKTSLRDCEFTGCDFEGSVFLDVRAKRTSFVRAKFLRAKLEGAKFKGCDFSGADLTGADFSNADLSSAIFRGAICTKARFTGANLRSANFIDAINLPEGLLEDAADANHIKLKTGGNRTPLPR